MSAPDSINPSIQYPDGQRIFPKEKVVGNGVGFFDPSGSFRVASKTNPLPVDISNVTINVSATGLATETTLAALLAIAATSTNQTIGNNTLDAILDALTGTSSTFDSVADFTVTTAGTAVQGANVATPRGVILTGLFTNAKQVYVGGSGVTNSGGGQEGMVLYAGQSSPVIPVSNLSQIWLNADANGEGCGVVIL